MSWLAHFISERPTAGALLALALVAFTGLALGQIRIRGIGLGIAGILFTGIFFGHFGVAVGHDTLEFARDAGLVLFVYTIGIQVGPGFIASLRSQGFTLNLLAVAIVVLGALIAALIARLEGVDVAVVAGLFAGATTNTPALGAAQEALKSMPGVSAEQLALPALGYAVSYPFGIIGIILSMLLLRGALKARPDDESDVSAATPSPPLERRNILIENGAYSGLALSALPSVAGGGFIISRIRRKGEQEARPVQADTVLHGGDVVLAVGTKPVLDAFCRHAGRAADVDLMKAPGRVRFRRVVVTRNAVLGKSLRELSLEEHHGVTVTRFLRTSVELTPDAGLRLQFGDQLQIVGEERSLDTVAAELGNSTKALNAADLLPMLLGIALGIFIGNIPIPIPGMPAPVALGNAGGPLIVAVILSRIGCFGPLRWSMPAGVNNALRELGIAIFLASVGLMAGSRFLDVLLHGDGFRWMALGALITLAPLLLTGFAARLFLRLGFSKICGLLAGSMTDPPALAFASTIARSDAPSVAYATVYPLAMTLRILLAQALVLLLAK